MMDMRYFANSSDRKIQDYVYGSKGEKGVCVCVCVCLCAESEMLDFQIVA